MNEHPIIALDPGHGGTAPGSVNYSCVEKHWNLETSFLVQHALWASVKDLVFTRAADDYLSLRKRGEIIQAAGADLAISIHVNSFNDVTKKGAYVFYWPGNEAGKHVALEIANCFPEKLSRSNMVQQADESWKRVRHVIKHHPHSCTSILIECAFGSNEEDREYILSYWGQRRIALAIASGILYFCEQRRV